jgi:hypothetical protein
MWCIGLIGFFAIGLAIGLAAMGVAAGLVAMDFAGAAGAAAGGVIGGDAGGGFCAQTGAEIARAAAMATLVSRCFMIVVLCGSSEFDTTATDTTATACCTPGRPCEPSVGNNARVVSFRRTRNRSYRVSDPAGSRYYDPWELSFKHLGRGQCSQPTFCMNAAG